jgi:hypothetical protein
VHFFYFDNFQRFFPTRSFFDLVGLTPDLKLWQDYSRDPVGFPPANKKPRATALVLFFKSFTKASAFDSLIKNKTTTEKSRGFLIDVTLAGLLA